MSKCPPLGWTTKARVVRTIDGDTLEVEISRRVRVRLIDCWAPEKRIDPRVPADQQEAEKARGIESASMLNQLLSGKTVSLHVPTDGQGDIGDIMTLSRVCGCVYLPDGTDVSAWMVRNGFATQEKPGSLK